MGSADDMSAPSGLPRIDRSLDIVPVSSSSEPASELDVFTTAALAQQEMMEAITHRVSMHGQVLVNHEDRLGEIERQMNIGPRMYLNQEF